MNNLDNVYSIKGDTPYIDVLELVQKHMSENFKLGTENMNSEETKFSVENMSKDNIFLYKKNIEGYITDKNIKCKDFDTLSKLIDALYNSMTQYDILTPYLQEQTYNKMGIEEIYGRFDCIYLLTKSGKIQLIEKFASKEICLNILNRLVSKFNVNVNEGTPTALGEFAPNIRVSVVSQPITSTELGAEFNIRIVHGSEMTREFLLGQGTIDKKGLDFLELCIERNINMCIAGSTGSGKTGTMYHLLDHASQNTQNRVGTIEIECREFDLIKYDEHGGVTNDVFHWASRFSDNERYSISASDLVEKILRFGPDIVGIGEMRNEEALIACEIGITGHGVITTIHSKNAALTYDRIVMLCKKARMGYDDKTLYKLALQAFPIIVFQKQFADGKRRIFEIVEGIGYKNDEVVINPLCKFIVTDNNEEQKISIGSFIWQNKISDNLRQELIDNGASKATADLY